MAKYLQIASYESVGSVHPHHLAELREANVIHAFDPLLEGLFRLEDTTIVSVVS